MILCMQSVSDVTEPRAVYFGLLSLSEGPPNSPEELAQSKIRNSCTVGKCRCKFNFVCT